MMFCPDCGTLGFVDPSGNIRCTNYKCGYEGPVGGKDGSSATVIGSDGQKIDIVNTKSSTKSTDLKHLTEVQAPDVARGTLRVGDYRCPKCDGDRIFVELQQTRSSDEPKTKICTCEACGHRFREYQ
ncbi:MAG: RPA12/RPB9/RPC11 RNA polymerase family protein [Candidatus Thalassarchaeaceae archaeon]|nr:RPA12/RPB9/RPC11 RNA polymerase family protein [Candidatus Thalassarchaeaceae archaeon]